MWPHSNMNDVQRTRGALGRNPSLWVPRLLLWLLLGILGTALAGCSTTPPDNVKVVTPFDLTRYLGQWYEIARLDHSFERDMNRVTAHYSLNPDGSVKVLNRGFNTKEQAWDEAIGRAKLTQGPDKGALKVSFFGPFYAGYFIVALDTDYQWAMVVGPDLSYFWILAREPVLDPAIKTKLLAQARKLGVETDAIIWVEH